MKNDPKSQSKRAKTVLRRSILVADQSSSHPEDPEDVFLGFPNRSNLQEFQHLQNQSFQNVQSRAVSPSIHGSDRLAFK